MFNSNTAHLLLSQEIDIMNFFSYISYRPNIIWYACDERKYFFPFRFEGCLRGNRSSQFGTFYFLVHRAEWSWWFAIFKFCNAWKASAFRVFLVCIFARSGQIQTRKTSNKEAFQAVLIRVFFKRFVSFV